MLDKLLREEASVPPSDDQWSEKGSYQSKPKNSKSSSRPSSQPLADPDPLDPKTEEDFRKKYTCYLIRHTDPKDFNLYCWKIKFLKGNLVFPPGIRRKWQTNWRNWAQYKGGRSRKPPAKDYINTIKKHLIHFDKLDELCDCSPTTPSLQQKKTLSKKPPLSITAMSSYHPDPKECPIQINEIVKLDFNNKKNKRGVYVLHTPHCEVKSRNHFHSITHKYQCYTIIMAINSALDVPLRACLCKEDEYEGASVGNTILVEFKSLVLLAMAFEDNISSLCSQMDGEMGDNYRGMVNSLKETPSTTVLQFPEGVSCNKWQFNYKVISSND